MRLCDEGGDYAGKLKMATLKFLISCHESLINVCVLYHALAQGLTSLCVLEMTARSPEIELFTYDTFMLPGLDMCHPQLKLTLTNQKAYTRSQ